MDLRPQGKGAQRWLEQSACDRDFDAVVAALLGGAPTNL